MSESAPRSAESVVRVGLLGCGEVGSAVARELLARDDFELTRIAVLDPDKSRPVRLDPALLTTDALDVALDPCIDIVIEAIGGVSPTIDFVSAALLAGKPVVTANKELLASPCGSSVFDIADRAETPLLYEAAVGGGVPIVRALKESLRGDRVERIEAVLNGTTNFVLDRMSDGIAFDDALLTAQAHGYAEADPSADTSGRDAAAKIALLGSIAFGKRFSIDDVRIAGIESVRVGDVSEATGRGNAIKMIATARRSGDDVFLSVGPKEVSGGDVLAGIKSENNCIVVDAELGGRLTFIGPGAGGAPTSSAVIGDVLAAAQHLTGTRRQDQPTAA